MTGTLITYSSELIKNYKAAEVMAASSAFQALQTADGHALLFSLGSDGAFHATQEKPQSKTGWLKIDLVKNLGAAAKKFAVVQNRGTSNIDLAVATTTGGSDTLYVCLGNSTSALDWIEAPQWVALPYDDAKNPRATLVVTDIMISEASDGQYIIVDVLRDPASGDASIFRYFIDPSRALTGHAWNPHDVPDDVDAPTLISCIGRRDGEQFDGIYTAGSSGGEGQLAYRPIYNVWHKERLAEPVSLSLPGDGVGTAMVAVGVGVAGDDRTELFVASGQTICYFPADGQDEDAVGTVVLDAPIFAGIRRLFGYGSASEVILWGVNGADEVFYTRCLRTAITSGGWSHALSLCKDVRQISPYINASNDGNSFFIHTGEDKLRRAAQSPATTIWKYDTILLPMAEGAKPHKASSYTTRIQVTDDNKQPLRKAAVRLGAAHRVGLDINGVYVVLDTQPVEVMTDALGAITIVEWVETLTATPLRVHGADGAVLVAINPADNAFSKAATLSTKDSLTGAMLPDTNGDPTTTPLVPPGASDDDLTKAATAIGQLADTYKDMPADGSVGSAKSAGSARAAPARASLAGRRKRTLAVQSMTMIVVGEGQMPQVRTFDISIPGIDTIVSAAGDAYSHLKDATNYAVGIVKEAGSEAWHFVAHIAGQAFSFVLDAVDKVVGALVAIYNAIKAAIEELIAWIEFLLKWPTFVRTKDACKKLLQLGLNETLGEIKPAFNHILDTARHGVDDWAGIKNTDGWSGGVENNNKGLGFMSTVIDAGAGFTAPAMYVYNHFIDNFLGAHGDDDNPGGQIGALLDRALATIAEEGEVLISAMQQIFELLKHVDFTADSLENILKKFTAIIVDTFLNTGQIVVDALLDLLVALAENVFAELDKPIWIPVLSDILVDVFGDSAKFSWLDFILMLGAIPAALICKDNTGSLPFASDDKITTNIKNAKSMAELRTAFAAPRLRATGRPHAKFGQQGMDKPDSTTQSVLDYVGLDIGSSDRQVLFIVCHVVAGIGSVVSALIVFPAVTGVAPKNTSYERAVTTCGVITGLAAFVTGIFAPPNPIKNVGMSMVATACSTATVIGKAKFGVQAYRASGAAAKEFREVGATLDGVLALLGMFPSCYHFYELSSQPSSSGRTEAILDETASICNAFCRLAQTGATLDDDPDTKTILAGIMEVLMLTYGALEIASGATQGLAERL